MPEASHRKRIGFLCALITSIPSPTQPALPHRRHTPRCPDLNLNLNHCNTSSLIRFLPVLSRFPAVAQSNEHLSIHLVVSALALGKKVKIASAPSRCAAEHDGSTKTSESRRRRITIHVMQRSALFLNQLMHVEPVRSRLNESLQSDRFPIAFQSSCRCNGLLSYF
jgi:hypothetical protein